MASSTGNKPKARTTRYAEMAEFAGVSDQTIRKWRKMPGFPAGPDGAVCLWDLAIWRYQMERGISATSSTESDPLDDFEGTSPNLERMRAANADMLEMKRDQQRGELLSAEDTLSILMDSARVHRKAGDRVTRRYGNEAGAIIEEAVQEGLSLARKRFGDAFDIDDP